MHVTKPVAWLAAGTAVVALTAGTAVAASLSGPSTTLTSSTSAAVTDDTLAERLAFSREEERMARDLYRLFSRRYDAFRPFGMIARSEQRHFEAVGTLLDAYDVTDPSAGLAAGTYADPELQALYTSLRKQGRASLAQAYRVGIAVEKRDLADLEVTLAAYDQEDVQLVLGRLADGSRMHLRAFQRSRAGASGTRAWSGWGNGPATMGRAMMGRAVMGRATTGWGRMRGADEDGAGSGRDGRDCPMRD